MIRSYGYASNHSFTDLKPQTFERPDARPNEVTIEVLYCGVCHSDTHQVKNEWGNTVYPVCLVTRSSAASRLRAAR